MLIIESVVNDINPVIFHLAGPLSVRWYGTAYMAGFLAAYVLFRWICVRQKAGLTPKMVGDFVTYAAFGVLLGGRLGYCLFYSPDLFFKFRGTPPFWGVLAINEGGMASHGGMIGLVLGCYIFAKKNGINHNYLYDLVALAGPIGIFFGRIANFINSELLGRPCSENFPLAVKFPAEILNWPNHEPEKLHRLSEILSTVPHDKIAVSDFSEVLSTFSVNSLSEATELSGVNLDKINSVLYQIVDSIQSGNTALRDALAPPLISRYPSQLFAALGEGLILFIILLIAWRSPRKPGVIGSLFIIFYAIIRIIDEQYRMPDAGIGYQLFDLTRGQWLSIAMLLLGIVLIFVYSRRGGLKTSGWGLENSVRLHRR